MTETLPTESSSAPGKLEASLHPTFAGALRGMWLFTWRSRVTWRKMSVALLILLILPVLVYLTVKLPEAWAQHHSLLGNPLVAAKQFSRRLRAVKEPLNAEQNRELIGIFAEEFTKAESAWRETKAPDSRTTGQNAQVKMCYERISTRVETFLSVQQFAQWTTYKQDVLNQTSKGRGERPGIIPGWSRTSPFYHWLIDFYFFVILPLSCVGACGALIREELQTDTLGFLTTRPLTRATLMVVKYLSQCAWLQIIVLAQALLLFAAGGAREIPELGKLIPMFLGIQFMAVFTWSALGAFLGLMTKRYMAIALLYGFIVEMGIGRIPTNINTLSMMRHLKSLLARNGALQEIYDWPMRGVPFSMAALALGTVVFLSMAAFLFTFKEYHHTAEMQK